MSEPRVIISETDRAMVNRARAGFEQAKQKLAWAQEELQARYGLRNGDRVNWITGEVFSPDSPSDPQAAPPTTEPTSAPAAQDASAGDRAPIQESLFGAEQ